MPGSKETMALSRLRTVFLSFFLSFFCWLYYQEIRIQYLIINPSPVMILTMRKRNRQMTRKKCFISRFDFIILCRIICRFILYYAINNSYVVLYRKVPSSPGGATCWTSLLLPPQLWHSMQPWTPGNTFFKFFSLIIDNITLDPDPNWAKILDPNPKSMYECLDWTHN